MSRLPTPTIRHSTLAVFVLVIFSSAIIASLYLMQTKTLHTTTDSATELVMAPTATTETVPPAKRVMLTAGTSSQITTNTVETPAREIIEKERPASTIPKIAADTVLSAPKVTPPKEAKLVPETTISAPEKPRIEIAELLRGHNAIRKKKGLSPLTWSSDLARGAQAWSEVLKEEGCGMRHDYTSGYGENIYWRIQTGGSITEMISDATAANRAWIAEEKFYDYDNNSCDPGEQCGHYTQIVWSDTKEVGCGVSSCIVDDSRTDVWVCRYDPHGNTTGQKPY